MCPFKVCFGGPKSITYDSNSFYKQRGEFRAPFTPFIGVHGPGTHPWGVYGRELLRELFSSCLRLLIRLWLLLDFSSRLRRCVSGNLTP